MAAHDKVHADATIVVRDVGPRDGFQMETAFVATMGRSAASAAARSRPVQLATSVRRTSYSCSTSAVIRRESICNV